MARIASRPRYSPARSFRPGMRQTASASISSSMTSASTIERPVPELGSPSIPSPSSEIASTTSPFRRVSSTRTKPPPCSSAFCNSSEKTRARAVAREPASWTGSSDASTALPDPRPWTSIARRRSRSSASSTSSSRRSISTSCTAAIARMRFTESSSARRGSKSAARDCRRRSEATVCRLFFTRWWISCATTPRMTARPCSSATAACDAIDASSASSSSLNGVSRSQTSSPICRRFQRSGNRTAYVPERPSGHAIFPSSSTSAAPVACTAAIVVFTIASSDSSRYSDSETASELGVLDRLRDLRGDRDEQLDLALAELARPDRANVERTLEPSLAREDRHGEDRLVLVLGQVRERLEARVEVRRRRDHHRGELGRRDAGDALPRPHARRARQLLDVRPVRRPQDQFVRRLVVEVHEARISLERVRDAPGDQPQNLLEIERRVDGRDRLREQAQVARALVHAAIVGVRLLL